MVAERKGRTSKKAFDTALAIGRGNAKPAKLYVPKEISVRDIRNQLNLSQEDFASEFGFTIYQIRDWEQGRSRPVEGLRAYLMIIQRDPQAVLTLLRRNATKRRAKKAT